MGGFYTADNKNAIGMWVFVKFIWNTGGIRMRILIAEDDMDYRRFLLKLLSKYGECDVVIDGLEALDAYLISIRNDKPYSLICLDIMMPKVNGVKVLKAIRDLEAQKGILPEKRSKIIIITVLAESQLVKDAFEIGCEAYITKPIDIQKLIAVTEDLLSWSNAKSISSG